MKTESNSDLSRSYEIQSTKWHQTCLRIWKIFDGKNCLILRQYHSARLPSPLGFCTQIERQFNIQLTACLPIEKIFEVTQRMWEKRFLFIFGLIKAKKKEKSYETQKDTYCSFLYSPPWFTYLHFLINRLQVLGEIGGGRTAVI